MSRSSIPQTLILGLCLALVASPRAAEAQNEVPPLNRTQFGIGYVGNAPEAIVGGAAYVMFPNFGGIGIYVDAKFDASSPQDELGFEEGLTDSEFQEIAFPDGDTQFNKEESSWRSFNVAVIRPLTPSFMAYVGGGLTRRVRYRNYNIPNTAPIGVGGLIWVEAPEYEATTANFMFGMMLRMTSRFTTQFGWETEPGGVTIGLSLRMPKW